MCIQINFLFFSLEVTKKVVINFALGYSTTWKHFTSHSEPRNDAWGPIVAIPWQSIWLFMIFHNYLKLLTVTIYGSRTRIDFRFLIHNFSHRWVHMPTKIHPWSSRRGASIRLCVGSQKACISKVMWRFIFWTKGSLYLGYLNSHIVSLHTESLLSEITIQKN